MKKLFILLLAPLFGFGQISVEEAAKEETIGEAKNGIEFVAKLTKVGGDPEMCYLTYRNHKYTHITDIKTISFSPENNTVNILYKTIKSFFEEHKKDRDYQLNVKLGDNDVTLSHYKILGIKGVRLSVLYKGHVILRQKDVDNLFGF